MDQPKEWRFLLMIGDKDRDVNYPTFEQARTTALAIARAMDTRGQLGAGALVEIERTLTPQSDTHLALGGWCAASWTPPWRFLIQPVTLKSEDLDGV